MDKHTLPPRAASIDEELGRIARRRIAIERKQRQQMVDAALVVYIAVNAGRSQASIAAQIGVAPATITVWRRLGRALMVGVDPTGDVFEHLAYRGAGSSPSISRAIEAETATPESIERALRRVYAADGRKIRHE